MSERIPCINPRCARTAPAERYPGSREIICRGCFRSLPVALRRQHKAYWSRVRLLRRLLKRKDMQSRLGQLSAIGDRNDRLGERVWRAIHAFFRPVDKPAGLDTFLEEMNL